jgi:hypothetical protein
MLRLRLLREFGTFPYDRKTFYTFEPHGYTDYPFYSEHSPAMSANGGAVV